MDYEERRRINIENNRRLLLSMNIQPLKRERKKKIIQEKVRKSKRYTKCDLQELSDLDEPKVRTMKNTKSFLSFAKLNYKLWEGGQVFGEIPGVPVGSLFPYRVDASRAGIHRPLVAGISGSSVGCYSIAVSGGYPEDVDTGYKVIFTGSGGRDLKGSKDKPKNLRTAAQTKDQELNRLNQSLIVSHNNNLEIRVIRGPKSRYKYAPLDCYRYDGLYKCVGYWQEKGESGFLVYRFELERIKGQEKLEELPRE